MSSTTRLVCVVHPDHAIRQAVRQACDSVHLTTAVFRSSTEFLAAPEPPAGGCLVLGLRIPGMNGLELLSELSRRDLAMPAIVVAGDADVPTAVDAMRRGVLDLLEPPLPPLRLLDAIHRALRVAEVVEEARRRYALVTSSLGRLSQRERQVLDRLLAGQPNKRIAVELGLSEKTVATHRNNVLSKMGADSVVELVRRVHPMLTLPQIFLNPLGINPVDILPLLLDSPARPHAG